MPSASCNATPLMSSNPNPQGLPSGEDPKSWFPEVADTWDLPKLYEDLEDCRRRALDETEKGYLRGLLHSGSRTQLAIDLDTDPGELREYLQEHLYPHIGKLTGNAEVASSKVPGWLAAQGYCTQAPATPALEATETALTTAPIAKDSITKRVLLGVGVTVLTGFITVLAEESLRKVLLPPEQPTAQTASQSVPASSPTPAASSTFADIDAPAGVFTYGGSTTWAPIRARVDAAIATAKPNYQIRYVDPIAGDPGSSRGIAMLLNNQLAFAQSSRPIRDDEYRRAKEKGFTLQEKQVAIDGIAVVVHPSLEISGLTVAQLQNIYRGNIRNWQELGGPDLEIALYSRDAAAGGTVEFFIKNVLQGQPLATAVQIVPNTTAGVRAVSKEPGGIYYASAPEVVPQCTVKPLPLGRTGDRFITPYSEPYITPEQCPERRNQVNAEAFKKGEYPITRALFVAIKANGQDDERAGKAYADLLLTAEGQASIEAAGFVPIR